MPKQIICSNCETKLDINIDFVYYDVKDDETLCFDCYNDKDIYERINI